MRQVCTSELIEDLYLLTQQNKLGWSTSARLERDIILGHLDSLPGWDGRTRRLIKTEYLIKNGTVLILERKPEHLTFSFQYVEYSGNIRYSTPEWRDVEPDVEPSDCNTCGAIMPACEDASCYHCDTQAVS